MRTGGRNCELQITEKVDCVERRRQEERRANRADATYQQRASEASYPL